MSDNQDTGAQDTIAILRKVRQVRQFSDREVPQEEIDDLLEVARWTGSGMNRQPWEFVLVRNQETLKEIAAAEAANSHLAGAKLALIVVMNGEMEQIEAYDEARLAERVMIAAQALGLGAGIWWFKDGGAAAKRILGIPEGKKVRTAISLGYEAESSAQRTKKKDARKPISELLHEERY